MEGMNSPAQPGMEDTTGPVFQKAVDSVMQGLATMYKMAAQMPGRIDPQVFTSVMDVMGQVENQWNTPQQAGADPGLVPGEGAPDQGIPPGAVGPDSIEPPPDQGFAQVANPGQQAGSFDEAAGALHAATQEDARKRGVR